MILPTPGPVTFVGIDSRGSGTGNPHFIVVAIMVSVPLEVFGSEARVKIGKPQGLASGVMGQQKVLSHNWLSVVDNFRDLFAAAFCRNLTSYTHHPNPLWYFG